MGAKYVATKQPAEIIPVTLNLSDYIPTGDSISSLAVTAVDSSGSTVTSTIISSSTYSGTNVTAIVKAGSSDASYTLKFTVTTTNYIFEEDVRLDVKERTAFT